MLVSGNVARSMTFIYRCGRPQLVTRTRKMARKMEENGTLAQMAEKNFNVKQFDLSSSEPQLDFNSFFKNIFHPLLHYYCRFIFPLLLQISNQNCFHTVVHTVAYNV